MLNAKAGPSVVCSPGCRTIRIHQIINKPEPSGWEENFKTASLLQDFRDVLSCVLRKMSQPRQEMLRKRIFSQFQRKYQW